MRNSTFNRILIAVFLIATAYFVYVMFDNDSPLNFADKKLNLGLDLAGGSYFVLEVDTSELTGTSEIEKALDSNIEVIRNRVDKFGLTEPVIQKKGTKQIIVQLPGIKDPARAKKLLGQTALLEFKLVANDFRSRRAVSEIDKYFAKNYMTDIKAVSMEANIADPTEEQEKDIFSTYITSSGFIRPEFVDFMRPFTDSLFALNKVLSGNQQIALMKSDDEMRAARGVPYVVLSSKAELDGSVLKEASWRFAESSSTQLRSSSSPEINLEFDRDGAELFAKVTGDNVGRQLAIVLDNIVYSAPNIQGRIPGGRAVITGSFSVTEAEDLTNILNNGSLKAPLKIAQESTVGPSLGKDSIEKGKMAGIIGLAIIFIFMLVYYKVSGIYANIALIFNILFILGMLTMFGAALTMPGIAGIILTIGMAVDANVLIFERIKEELRNDRSVNSSIEAGFKRAVITITDANITTLIAAVVLYSFGSGAIRGFAVTLMIGIVGSMFSAIVLVRSMFNTFIVGKKKEKLSI